MTAPATRAICCFALRRDHLFGAEDVDRGGGVAPERREGRGGDVVLAAEEDRIAGTRRPRGGRHRVPGLIEEAIRMCSGSRPSNRCRSRSIESAISAGGVALDLLGREVGGRGGSIDRVDGCVTGPVASARLELSESVGGGARNAAALADQHRGADRRSGEDRGRDPRLPAVVGHQHGRLQRQGVTRERVRREGLPPRRPRSGRGR